MPIRKDIFHLVLLLLAVAAALPIAGCGGSSDNSGSTTSGEGTAASKPPEGETAENGGSGGGFKGPANIVKFGKPASEAELEAASEVLSENLEARESGDFAGQCSSLSASAQAEVSGTSGPAAAKECGTKLEELAMPLKSTEEIRTDTLDPPIDELRVKGPQAFALYHGNDGKNWAMPLTQEKGTWKVAAIVTTEVK